jgi:peptidoglycan/xylan/chitin deacetylase (PgdA/CDA1 family)
MPLPVVLLYHSVDDRNGRSDTWNLSVSPGNFADQVEVLVSERTVVPLEELARCVRAGCVPRRYAAITFDDGYANNFIIAKPVLERYNAPATLFLMTAAANSSGFWWDRLERIIMEADFLPPVLCISLLDRTLEITVEGSDRRQTFVAIWSHLRELDADDRDSAIASLASALAVQPPADPALRPLTTDEVQRLKHSILSIGAHTHSHPSLPRLGPTELMREIADSKAICESLLDRQVTAFAYPFGDYDDRVRAAVAEAGLTVACATGHRSVQADDDCLALPRIGVGNWPSDQFIRYVSELSCRSS